MEVCQKIEGEGRRSLKMAGEIRFGMMLKSFQWLGSSHYVKHLKRYI